MRTLRIVPAVVCVVVGLIAMRAELAAAQGALGSAPPYADYALAAFSPAGS